MSIRNFISHSLIFIGVAVCHGNDSDTPIKQGSINKRAAGSKWLSDKDHPPIKTRRTSPELIRPPHDQEEEEEENTNSPQKSINDSQSNDSLAELKEKLLANLDAQGCSFTSFEKKEAENLFRENITWEERLYFLSIFKGRIDRRRPSESRRVSPHNMNCPKVIPEIDKLFLQIKEVFESAPRKVAKREVVDVDNNNNVTIKLHFGELFSRSKASEQRGITAKDLEASKDAIHMEFGGAKHLLSGNDVCRYYKGNKSTDRVISIAVPGLSEIKAVIGKAEHYGNSEALKHAVEESLNHTFNIDKYEFGGGMAALSEFRLNSGHINAEDFLYIYAPERFCNDIKNGRDYVVNLPNKLTIILSPRLLVDPPQDKEKHTGY